MLILVMELRQYKKKLNMSSDILIFPRSQHPGGNSVLRSQVLLQETHSGDTFWDFSLYKHVYDSISFLTTENLNLTL